VIFSQVQDIISDGVNFILDTQLPSGAIPYYPDGVVDPWDHVACAMALDACGKFRASHQAYQWLRTVQNPDGSWWYTYLGDRPGEMTKDSNHSSYAAAGVWHHYLATHNRGFLREMWEMVEHGIDFTLGLQQSSGEIFWARDGQNNAWPSAPVAGCACIWKSLQDALKIAGVLKLKRPDWHEAADKLQYAIQEKPHLFNTLGDNQRGYAMGWYYPVLTGVSQGEQARAKIYKGWDDFVINGWGCKCTLDQPWVTTAETCELIMTLVKIGDHSRAKTLLNWVFNQRDADGGFWTGIKLPEKIIYPPDEKNTWTAASVILATMASIGGEAISDLY
jgi:MMP endo-(1,4)-3-O-methyl-alpha-D-mannosidase